MTDAHVSSSHDSRFELTVSLPPDSRFADTARELAVHAARQAGCPDAKAHAFGEQVAGLVLGSLQGGSPGARVPLVLRRTTGPIEVLVDGRMLTLDA